MSTAADRVLRKAMAQLVAAVDREANGATNGPMARLRVAAYQAAEVLNTTRVVQIKLDPPRERRGPHSIHTEHGCGGECYDVKKGSTWVLWCERCGYFPRVWRIRRRPVPGLGPGAPTDPSEMPDTSQCRQCLVYVAEEQRCGAFGSRPPNAEPVFDEPRSCFVPLEADTNAPGQPEPRRKGRSQPRAKGSGRKPRA